MRRKKVSREGEGGGGGGGGSSKRRKIESNEHGYEWFADELFEIEHLLDKKMVTCQVGKGKAAKKKDYPQYLVLWKGYPPECASWQWPAQRGVTGGIPRAFVDEYEAGLEAEAQLDAEEAAEEAAEDDEDDEGEGGGAEDGGGVAGE